ncbi:MAG: PKD domain-containing protein [Saprospiraceae bacterium]|nr:PKD domain-containing protein [Saprospiraceae bacterium]MCF8249761.1 PKD domain-containing protein [Saprospiraceae bacterium]
MNRYLFMVLSFALLCGCGKDDPTPGNQLAPVACFTLDKAECAIEDCTVNFDASCAENAANYEWDFGDGSPVVKGHDLQQVSHTYTSGGVKTVKLTVTSELTISGDQEMDETTMAVLVKEIIPPFITTFGGTFSDIGRSVQQTSDGGYIITGTGRNSNENGIYLVKTDRYGDLLWDKIFGTSGNTGQSVQQTQDGGYIIVGDVFVNGTVEREIHLIKADQSGSLVWEKYFSGAGEQNGLSVQQTSDGGYIIAGDTRGGGLGPFAYLIKTDPQGNQVWNKKFDGNGNGNAMGYCVQQTQDGGYIIAGTTSSNQADVYLVKTDPNGNLVWEKTFGGSLDDQGFSVQQTSDGGYIITGLTDSEGAGSFDVYLIKTDQNGDQEWAKTFGDIGDDRGFSVQQTQDGGYIIAGWTQIGGVGNSDVYLIKTDQNGTQLWFRTFGGVADESGFSVQQTQDGGYIIAGLTTSQGAGGSDVYLIKTDENGFAE